MKNVNIENFNEKNFVDEFGNVYTFHKRENKLFKRKLTLDRYGYLYVELTSNNSKQRKKFKVHRLIALTYLKNKDNKPTVNHKDGNKTNNNLNNLEFMTNKEQQIHYVNNLKTKKEVRTIYVFNNNLELIDKHKGFKTLMEKYKITKSFIQGSINKEYFCQKNKYGIYLRLKKEKPIFKKQKYGNIKIKELNDNKIFNSITEASEYYGLKNCFIIEGIRKEKSFFHVFRNKKLKRYFHFVKI